MPSEIRLISAEAAQRIVAGQSVTDLASAVKELVDNSLDAKSTNINSKYAREGSSRFSLSDILSY